MVKRKPITSNGQTHHVPAETREKHREEIRQMATLAMRKAHQESRIEPGDLGRIHQIRFKKVRK